MQNNNKITTDIQFAVRQLKAGGLVAFPTETVYGLGADASNPIAVQKVFTAKGRPADHPLIVHIASIAQLSSWADPVPEAALLLAQHFWPGPLTLILHKHNNVSPLITGGQDTIAIRIPRHPVTLQLLEQFGSGIVGPSANKYGRVSPTCAAHVAQDLGSDVATILEGGSCDVGIESTIIDLSSTQPKIMRRGAITAMQIAKVLQQDVLCNDGNTTIRTPGSHLSHYAPVTRVRLVASENLLAETNQLQLQQQKFSVISFQSRPANLASNIQWQQVAADPIEYAHYLYANLRSHDQLQNSLILIEQPPLNDSWLAINDRLTRASA